MKWGPYGSVKPIPANLRNYLGMLDENAGKGPLYMQTAEAIANLAAEYKDDPKAFKKKMKTLENEAWEDFLDMTVSQAILWQLATLLRKKKLLKLLLQNLTLSVPTPVHRVLGYPVRKILLRPNTSGAMLT